MLVRQTKELKEYQDTPSPKEDLEKIPMLTRDEIGREPAKLIFEETKLDGITVVRHEMFTSGIGYLKVLFNTNRVPMEDRRISDSKIRPRICGYEELQLQ